MTTIGLLHPGEMGASVGRAARANGHRVLWASHGRGPDTAARAAGAGLEDAGTLHALASASGVILSACPPHAAVDVARAVAAAGFRGLYVDGNAVAPATARGLGALVEKAGATFVDGGIVGPPPDKPGTTRLYLSGPAARVDESMSAFWTFVTHDWWIAIPMFAMSLTGIAFVIWRLLLNLNGKTDMNEFLPLFQKKLESEGVDGALVAEWQRSQPDLPKRSESAARGSARKAWRWVGEMDEIAAAFAAANLPDGFHRAAGEVYRRLSPYKDAGVPPTIEDVAKTLRKEPRP